MQKSAQGFSLIHFFREQLQEKGLKIMQINYSQGSTAII
jgi:hypothetical protein